MAQTQDQSSEPFICPHCGAEVAAGATFCRQCGSDDDTGWSEDVDQWRADVPTAVGDEDDDFDYDEFVAREFPERAGPPAWGRWAVTVLVIVVTLALVLWLVWPNRQG